MKWHFGSGSEWVKNFTDVQFPTLKHLAILHQWTILLPSVLNHSNIFFSANFYSCKHILGVGMLHSSAGEFPGKGGWDTGVGRSSSIFPIRGILIESPCPGKLANVSPNLTSTMYNLGKFFYPKLIFANFTLWELLHSHTHSHTHKHTHTHTNTHTYTHTLSFSLSLSHTHTHNP